MIYFCGCAISKKIHLLTFVDQLTSKHHKNDWSTKFHELTVKQFPSHLSLL